jgi:broad specificity phosphatase PhoE
VSETHTAVESAATAATCHSDVAVVSSPHRRAIDTAHLVFPQHTSQSEKKVVILESVREHSGLLLNGKRLPKSELQVLYPECDFSFVEDEEDMLWTDELEEDDACRERAYNTLQWIFGREESTVVVAAHGGILGKMMEHARVEASEEMMKRFSTAECRSCEVVLQEETGIFTVALLPRTGASL